MQYFYKKIISFDNVSDIRIETEGNTTKPGHFYVRVERIIQDGLYTYYYYPLEGSLLMCLYFSYNMDDFDKAYDNYMEYFQYAERTWPKFCDAYLRGKHGIFGEEPFIYKFRDFGSGDNRTCAWLLCQKVPYISPNEIYDEEQYVLACSLIRYANDMLQELLKKNISTKDKIKINATFMGKSFLKKLGTAIIKESLK